MERLEVITRIAAALITTPTYETNEQNNEALVNDAAAIADLIMSNDDNYQRTVVTTDDEDAIAEIEANKKQTQSRLGNNSFIQEDEIPG